jgi:ABC-type multidrug transport system ATPase subunit
VVDSVDSLPPAVETSGLGRRYGRRWALVDVTLRVPRGVRVMLTGRTGSGKSTLLRVLATALRPDRGDARVAGHDVLRERDSVRRQSALLGHYSGHYEALTALENLQIAARFLGADGGAPALRDRLGEFGLGARADDPVSTFSAGMRKRLALARTLMQPASVVMLDEPYGELDVEGFALVDALLQRLHAERRTVLMATHLLERGRELCDEAVVLEQGRLVWTGAAGELPMPDQWSERQRGVA